MGFIIYIIYNLLEKKLFWVKQADPNTLSAVTQLIQPAHYDTSNMMKQNSQEKGGLRPDATQTKVIITMDHVLKDPWVARAKLPEHNDGSNLN